MASSSGSSFSHSSISSFVPIVSLAYCSAPDTEMNYSSEKREPVCSNLVTLPDDSSYSGNNESGDGASCSTLTTLYCKSSETKLISTGTNINSSVEVSQSSKYCLSSVTSSNICGAITHNPGHDQLGGRNIVQDDGVVSIEKAKNYVALKTESLPESLSDAVVMPKNLFDIHSVAHKKKLHYQREVLQQQQKHMHEIHNKRHPSFENQSLPPSFSSVFSHKKDFLPTVEDIQSSITIGSSYFPNLPLHHEQNLASSPALQQDSSRCSQGDSNASRPVEADCKVDSLAFDSETCAKDIPENGFSSELINNLKLHPSSLQPDASSVDVSASLVRSVNGALTSNDPLNYCQAAFEAMEGPQLQNTYGNLLDKYSQGPANQFISSAMASSYGFSNCIDFSLKQAKLLSNSSDQDLPSSRTNDCSQSPPEKRNEGKHFTDISDLTVPKSISASISEHISSEHVYMQSHLNLEATTSDSISLKNSNGLFTKGFISASQYHGENFESEQQSSMSNSKLATKSSPFMHYPAPSSSRNLVQSLQHHNGDDSNQNERLVQKPTAMVAEDLSKIEKIDQHDLLEPFLLSNNEETAPACSDNSFLGNVINCNSSDRENEDGLPNVDDLNICLNLAMPPYTSQSLSTSDKSSVNFPYPPQNPYYMNSQSSHSINTMFNSSFNQSSALLSPAHSALTNAFYPSTNFEDFVQSNFPLYPNLPPFHPSNLTFPPPDIPVGSSAYSQGNKSLSSSGFLGASNTPMSPASHPINLAPESSSAYDPQASTMPSHSLPAPIPISLALQPFHASQILNSHSFPGNHVPSCLSSNPIMSQSHSIQSFSSSAFASRSPPPVPPSSSSLFLQPSGTMLPPPPPHPYCAGKVIQSQVSPSTPTHLLSNILSHSLPIITPPKFSQTPEKTVLPKAVSQQIDSTSSSGVPEGLPSRSAPSYCSSVSTSVASSEFSSKPPPTTPMDRDNSYYPVILETKPTRTSAKLVKPTKSKISSPSKEVFSCSKCSQEYHSLKQLNKHKLSNHETRSLECNICMAAFKDRPSLHQHRQKQCCRRRYICRYCNRAFGGSSSLATHRRIHTGETPYQCTHCGKRFRQRVTLKSHLLVHTGERPFQCRVCNLRFSQRATLGKHFRSHMAEAKLKCGLCSSLLKDKEGLARHMKMPHFKCDYCDESFCNSKKRESHVLKCHEDTRPFKCELCPSTFAVKLNYTKHKNSIHRKVDLICDECGAKFKRTDRFNAHKKIHSKEGSAKVHNCQLCCATFNQRNSLSKHYRAIHNVGPKKDAQLSTTDLENVAESAS